MKKNFRKVISVICVLALLMSAVSVVLTTSSSAADITCKDVTGVWDISDSASAVVKDGENVLYLRSHPATVETAPSRTNFAPVNAAGDGYFEVAAGKTYCVIYDYMVDGLNEGSVFTTALYLGNTSKASGKKALTDTNTTNYYVTKMSAVKNVWMENVAYFTIPADSQLITDTTKHLFVTFYTGTGLPYDLYIKNVRCEEVTDKKLIAYYDNGYQYFELGNAGDTITRVGQHAVEGEKFMGWYSEPDFVTGEYLVTEIPETEGKVMLFARYPSTVIEFNLLRGKYAGGKSSTDANKYFNVLNTGIAESRSNDPNGGTMIPAYDYDGYSNNGKFFQFDVTDLTKSYKLTFSYMNADLEGKSGSNAALNFIPASAYGSGEWRIGKAVGPTTISKMVKGSSEINTFEVNIVGSGDYSYIAFVNKDHSDATQAGLAVRGYAIDFDKIVITEYSDATAAYMPSHVTLKDDVTSLNDTFVVAPGEVKALPVLKDTADKIFAGWYDSSYVLGEKTEIFKQIREDPNDSKSNIIGVQLAKDLAPKNCVVGDGKDYSLVAMWVPKEVKVNFTGDFNTGSNYLSSRTQNNYCSADIYFDAEAGGMKFEKNSSENGYRFILYDDNGKPVAALEGVDYEITIEYAVTNDTKPARIAILRDCKGLQNPCAVTGSTGNGPAGNDEYFIKQTTAELVSRATASINVTVKNTMDYKLNGADVSKPYIKNVFAISPRYGEGVIYSVTVKALGYHPQTYGKNCDIEIDYENGVATILPHEGYEFKFGTVKAYSLINDTLSNKVALDVDDSCYKMGGYDLSKTGIDLAHIVVEAEAAEEGTIENNSKIVASSYQVKKNPGDLAGIRFLDRVTEQTMENFENAYFAVVPTALMGGKNMLEYLDDDDNLAAVGVAYDKNESIDIVYAMNGGVIDYQVYLQGLVPELENVEMTVCFIGVKGSGESVILGEKQDSYESIFNRVNG